MTDPWHDGNDEEEAMKQSGFFWHIHHDVLVEWSDDIQERIDYIKKAKPEHEIETRLRLLKPVVGALPEKCVKARAEHDKAWAEYAKARAEYAKAWAEYARAWAEHDKARAEYAKARAECVKARAEYDKAWAEYAKARAEYDKAWAEHDKAWAEHAKARAEIEALHAVECPDCPWQNGTIFPEDKP